eukprot:jgi/Tetstr1/432232/TSEL_002268.t1
MAVRLVASRELPQPACSAEFCAVAPPRPAAAVNLLAVGTYLLADQASQTKTGCVHLYRVQKTEEGDGPSVRMEEAAEFPTTAVFDIKWRPHCEDGEHLVVAVAGADGKASILHVQDGGEGCDPGGMVVTQACAEHVGEEGTMALSLDWGHRSVCCLQSHPSREFTLCSGSYDEKIRVWDTRNMRAPVTMFSHDNRRGRVACEMAPTQAGAATSCLHACRLFNPPNGQRHV